MMVIFVSLSEKKSQLVTRRILDLYADRIGQDTWQTVITREGLETVRTVLRRSATKDTAVSCRWIRSRNRSDLLWIVGNRNKFNQSGLVPVNTTTKSILHNDWENSWIFLPVIKEIAACAALIHDWGKSNDIFQKKLRDFHKKDEIKMDPFRHEWVSCKLLEAVVYTSGGETDERNWIRFFADGSSNMKSIEEYLSEQCAEEFANVRQLRPLPPIAETIAWLILSHHRMPVPVENKKRYADIEKRTMDSVFKSIRSNWGYESKEQPDSDSSKKCFTFSRGLLWEEAPVWRKFLKKWYGRLLNDFDSVSQLVSDPEKQGAFRETAYLTRLCLMLGDHYASSLPCNDDKSRWGKSSLWANTGDKNHPLRQLLEEHLVLVTEQVLRIAHKLPYFSASMEQAYDIRSLKKPSPPAFHWQDKASDKIKKFRQSDPRSHGYFIVNMASTGCGKTFANAKIIRSISADGDSLRYILALGLRTLTLQTGDEYREKIGLSEDMMSVLIGSATVAELHRKDKQANSESSTNQLYEPESLLPEGLEFVDDETEEQFKFLDIFLHAVNRKGQLDRKSSARNHAFLYKPVLVSTIDQLMGVTETQKGGRYILPMLRLMSSDLVIDEIDDFNEKDLIAISRLVHTAGMFGRNVVISSATIPPDLAEGMYRAYTAGLICYNEFFPEKKPCAAVFCDEFRTAVKNMVVGNTDTFREIQKEFITRRAESLKEKPVRRKAYIADISLTDNESEDKEPAFFESAKHSIIQLHNANHVIDKRTGKKVSFGVVRVANITPCVKLSQYLLETDWPDDTAPRIMTYHSRQVLLMRHEQEKYLDSVLRRKYRAGIPVEFSDPVIRKHIDETPAGNIIFIIVATPVEEVGRDHDLDWAVVEPSSYRSFIQLAGRILRHRFIKGDVKDPNMAILQWNLRGLKGASPAYCYPGFESTRHRLITHDLKKLVDEEEMARRIDSLPRIVKPSPLHPAERLIDLEHLVMEEFNDPSKKGPDGMEGWLHEYWWLTSLPQNLNRFRENFQEERKIFYLFQEGIPEFHIKEDGDFIKYENVLNITKNPSFLNNVRKDRLWLKRDYQETLEKRWKEDSSEDDPLRALSAKYGEITIPVNDKQWFYSDDFGLFSK
jgi:CRISPR-associated endonuclease/helicase Cas3